MCWRLAARRRSCPRGVARLVDSDAMIEPSLAGTLMLFRSNDRGARVTSIRMIVKDTSHRAHINARKLR